MEKKNKDNSKQDQDDFSKSPHDAFFKLTMKDPDTARNFLENYLPPYLHDVIQFDSFTIQNGSFIDENLKETHSDLLFKSSIKDQDVFLYFLFEHKSYPDKTTGFQLLQYIVRIWKENYINDTVPIVIPVVVYHGGTKWPGNNTLQPVLAGIEKLPEEAKKHIPDFEYLFYDFSFRSKKAIQGNVKVIIFLETIKASFAKDTSNLMNSFYRIVDLLVEYDQQLDKEYFEKVIKYLINVRDDIGVSDLKKVSQRVPEERRELIMSLAQRLKNEGFEEGVVKGMDQGKLESRMEIARSLLLSGFSVTDVMKHTNLPIEKIKKLKQEITNKPI